MSDPCFSFSRLTFSPIHAPHPVIPPAGGASPLGQSSKQIPIRLNLGQKLGSGLTEGFAAVMVTHGLQKLDCVHRSGLMIQGKFVSGVSAWARSRGWSLWWAFTENGHCGAHCPSLHFAIHDSTEPPSSNLRRAL